MYNVFQFIGESHITELTILSLSRKTVLKKKYNVIQQFQVQIFEIWDLSFSIAISLSIACNEIASSLSDMCKIYRA